MLRSQRTFSVRPLGLAGLSAALFLSTTDPSAAGGFDRGGVNIDLLFDDRRFVTEATGTVVAPQRDISDVSRGANLTAILDPTAEPDFSENVEVEGTFFVPRVGLKLGLGRHFDCLGHFSQPFGADARYGINNAYSATTVEFFIDTTDLGVTCSAKANAGMTPLGQGRVRVIGGFSFLSITAFQSRQTFADFVGFPEASLPGILTGLNPEGLGLFSLTDNSFGFRAGLAYEIPDIALQVYALYSSSYDLDLTGTVNIGAFNTPFAAANPIAPTSATTEIPQSVELKLQSGINENTLLFGSFKWQEWSELGSIPIEGVLSPTFGTPTFTAFEPLYRDGFTVSTGVGRRFSENLAGRLAFTYDRGTSTIAGSQTDTFTLSGGFAYIIDETVEVQLGGAVGLLTGGTSLPTGGDPANDLTYSFGADVVGAVSASIKLAF